MSRSSGGLDIRELVVQIANRDPAHGGPARPRPEIIQANYRIDESLTEPPPRVIGIFDDVLTTGCQFRAMQGLLRQRFPGIHVVGFFWARRVPEPGPSPSK
jgi:predicted amidophosphoribosyltransferase